MTKNQTLGDKYKTWCAQKGRQQPPDELVDAMNYSFDEGMRVAKGYVQENPQLYKNVRSFLARSH